MCPLIVRLLLHMYTIQTLQVKWNDATSMSFSVTNGVLQGGVMSPHASHLYIIYIYMAVTVYLLLLFLFFFYFVMLSFEMLLEII